jgi:secondary thiamine-phosphate synthase enzyme
METTMPLAAFMWGSSEKMERTRHYIVFASPPKAIFHYPAGFLYRRQMPADVYTERVIFRAQRSDSIRKLVETNTAASASSCAHVMAQELLTTFADELGEVALVPAPAAYSRCGLNGESTWNKKQAGRVLNPKQIKQLIRDRIGVGERPRPHLPPVNPHDQTSHYHHAGQGLHEFTDQLNALVRDCGVREGLCTLFVQHTSASLLIQENADPSARHDLEQWLNRLVKENDPIYTHQNEGPDDMPGHVKSALILTQISIPSARAARARTWQVYLWSTGIAAERAVSSRHIGVSAAPKIAPYGPGPRRSPRNRLHRARSASGAISDARIFTGRRCA